jgi:tRNA threonylcarbamoyladenosine biosynthesis protein TsaE
MHKEQQTPVMPEAQQKLPFTVITSSPEETQCVGEAVAASLKKGSVLALKGPLGAGKTCLVKGIARALGVCEEITSPTYTIVSEYESSEKIPFFHIDAYRLGGDDDFAALGGEEYLEVGIAVIEWSERIPASLPSKALTVEIEVLDGSRRRITAEGGS